MALTTVEIKAAKPNTRGEYKLADGGGLYLLVTATGSKLWRWKYRFDGKEKKLSLGVYPDVSAAEARELRDAAKKLLSAGKDPGLQKRLDKQQRKIRSANTFALVAEEYIAKREKEGVASVTTIKARWLVSLLNSAIGQRPIGEISAQELLSAIRPTEASGRRETARRLRSFSGRVFRYAVATGRAQSDPSSDIRGALVAPKVKHRAAIIEPKRLGELLRAIEEYGGQPATKAAMQILPHVFVRPGELRNATWAEFDLASGVWVIPPARTKMRKEHRVPLSAQVQAHLLELRELTGRGQYVFPAIGVAKRPLSENTFNQAMRRMGFDGTEMVAHGFRATASTFLNESGKWNPDAIERALAHGERDGVRAAYHRGSYWQERVEMMQWWSNKLDALRNGAQVIPMRRDGVG